jgi:hypothetical protein
MRRLLPPGRCRIGRSKNRSWGFFDDLIDQLLSLRPNLEPPRGPLGPEIRGIREFLGIPFFFVATACSKPEDHVTHLESLEKMMKNPGVGGREPRDTRRIARAMTSMRHVCMCVCVCVYIYIILRTYVIVCNDRRTH